MYSLSPRSIISSTPQHQQAPESLDKKIEMRAARFGTVKPTPAAKKRPATEQSAPQGKLSKGDEEEELEE